jgi:hypothetical protein
VSVHHSVGFCLGSLPANILFFSQSTPSITLPYLFFLSGAVLEGRKALCEEMAFDERPGLSEGESQVKTWEQDVPSRVPEAAQDICV